MAASKSAFPTTEARALIDKDPWLRTLSEAIPALIWCSGVDGLCTYFNYRWLQFTGRSLEESLGDGWAKDVHPDDVQRVVEDYYRFFEARQDFRLEYRLKYQGGPYKWIVDFGAPVFDGKTFFGYIGGCSDVTMINGLGLATSWREKHEAALQSGTRELAGRIWTAEVAMRDLLDETSDKAERECLHDSLETLDDLKKKRMGLD